MISNSLKPNSMIVSLFMLAIFILLPINSAESREQAEPGSKCKKVGRTSVNENMLYVCIKKNKRLIWDSGRKIKNQENQVEFRKDWELLYTKIWDQYVDAQSAPNFPFVYTLSPTVNQAKAKESIDAYAKAMKPWMVILNGAKLNPIYWTIMSEKDYLWWKEVVEKQEPNRPNYAWNPETNMLGHCQLSNLAFCGYGATYASNTPDFKFLQYNVIGSNYILAPNSNTVNHEAAHFYQFAVLEGFPNDTPCWYVEGQASLYGNALEFNPRTQLTRTNSQRENFKNIVRQYQREANSYSPNQWVSVLQKMYFGDVSCSQQQDYFKYAVGMFNWEYLIQTYGAQKMHTLLLDFKKGKSFKTSILDNLDIEFLLLEEKLALHLTEVFAGGN